MTEKLKRIGYVAALEALANGGEFRNYWLLGSYQIWLHDKAIGFITFDCFKKLVKQAGLAEVKSANAFGASFGTYDVFKLKV